MHAYTCAYIYMYTYTNTYICALVHTNILCQTSASETSLTGGSVPSKRPGASSRYCCPAASMSCS